MNIEKICKRMIVEVLKENQSFKKTKMGGDTMNVLNKNFGWVRTIRKTLFVLISMAVLLPGFSRLMAEELNLQKFIYTQDFEESDPARLMCAKGKYTVNFKGLTEEKVFSGKKSFKLDVTFDEASYCYWYIPIRVPAEGNLNFSCRVLVEEETTANFAMAANVLLLLPSRWAGLGTCFSSGPTKDEWKLKEMTDFVKLGKDTIRRWRTTKFFGMEPEDVGGYRTQIIFNLRGQKGQRTVFYIDDIKLEGEVPSEADYDNLTNKRWEAFKKRQLEKIEDWLTRLAEIEKGIKAISVADSSDKEFKKELELQASSLREKIEKREGHITPSEHKSVETTLSQLSDMCKGF